MVTTVLTALGHDWEGRMVEVVDRLPGVEVVRRCVDLADLLAAASAGTGDVALVSSELRGLDRDALAHLRTHGVGVLGASRDGDEGEERHLRQLGIARVVHPATPPEDLADVLLNPTARGSCPLEDDDPEAPVPAEEAATVPTETATEETSPQPHEQHHGQVVAVWGPTGAPGRSTLAVTLASEIAAGGTSVLLVDLDTYGAAVAQLLSVLDEAPGLVAAVRASELGTLDLPAMARLAGEVAPRFRVLTGIPTPGRWTEVRAAAVEQVIDLGRRLAEVVVLDCGFGIEDDEELSYDTLAPRRNATTLVGLAQADHLYLVGAGDPVGLQRMARAAQTVGQVPSPTPRPVVNRVRASAVGSDPRRRIGDSMARFAGLEDITFLPEDQAATDTALLTGRTLTECAPESPLRLAIAELAADITGRTPVREVGRRGLLSRLGVG